MKKAILLGFHFFSGLVCSLTLDRFGYTEYFHEGDTRMALLTLANLFTMFNYHMNFFLFLAKHVLPETYSDMVRFLFQRFLIFKTYSNIISIGCPPYVQAIVIYLLTGELRRWFRLRPEAEVEEEVEEEDSGWTQVEDVLNLTIGCVMVTLLDAQFLQDPLLSGVGKARGLHILVRWIRIGFIVILTKQNTMIRFGLRDSSPFGIIVSIFGLVLLLAEICINYIMYEWVLGSRNYGPVLITTDPIRTFRVNGKLKKLSHVTLVNVVVAIAIMSMMYVACAYQSKAYIEIIASYVEKLWGY